MPGCSAAPRSTRRSIAAIVRRSIGAGKATREHHPARASGGEAAKKPASGRSKAHKAPRIVPGAVRIPNTGDAVLALGTRQVRLTNLDKPFWPELGITKRELLQYYADIAPVLLPHLADRAMVMKRYPDGADGEPFFMKRAPSPRPDWIETCAIAHALRQRHRLSDGAGPGLAALGGQPRLHRPQPLVRALRRRRPAGLPALRPRSGARGDLRRRGRDGAARARRRSRASACAPIVKTTGSKGLHVYVAIVRGPTQKDVWRFAKRFAIDIAALRPELITAEYRIAKRPAGRVLVDYNQNAWGRTLASVYSPRPRPRATVSAPVTWDELEAGAPIDDFDLRNMPARVAAVGDLWSPLLADVGRFDLAPLLRSIPRG